MAQPSVSHDGFVFGEFEEIGPSAKRKEVTKNIKKRRAARELALKFKAKVLDKRKEKDPIYRQALNKFDTSIKAKEEQIEKIKRDIEALRIQKAAKEANQLAEQKGWRERRFAAESELRNLHYEITELQKEIAQEELEEVLNAAKLKEEAEKIKAAIRKAKILEKQAERDEKLAKKKADREERDKERQELREKEREAKKKQQDAEREKKRAQELQIRLFKKKYKGKIFYFENPDQVEDTQFLTRINNERSYYQNFTSFFTGGSNFYYLADDKISAYDFDVSALRIIAEPYLKSLDNGVTFEYGKNLSDGERDWQGFLEDLQDNNYYMKDKPWSLKNAEKFARGMDNVFKSDPRAQKNTDVESAKGQNVRYGVAFDKSMGAGHFVFKTKKEKIKVEKPIEPSSVLDEEDDFSMSEDEEDDFPMSEDEDGDEFSDINSGRLPPDFETSSDESDKDDEGWDSNISSALDLIKI